MCLQTWCLSTGVFLSHPKAESQNRSYIVRSSATFNVIEMPYKNLVSEFPSNSTAVSVIVRFQHNFKFKFSFNHKFGNIECANLPFQFHDITVFLTILETFQWRVQIFEQYPFIFYPFSTVGLLNAFRLCELCNLSTDKVDNISVS